MKTFRTNRVIRGRGRSRDRIVYASSRHEPNRIAAGSPYSRLPRAAGSSRRPLEGQEPPRMASDHHAPPPSSPPIASQLLPQPPRVNLGHRSSLEKAEEGRDQSIAAAIRDRASDRPPRLASPIASPPRQQPHAAILGHLSSPEQAIQPLKGHQDRSHSHDLKRSHDRSPIIAASRPSSPPLLEPSKANLGLESSSERDEQRQELIKNVEASPDRRNPSSPPRSPPPRLSWSPPRKAILGRCPPASAADSDHHSHC